MEKSNLKVLFINIFSVLFIAGSSSIRSLQLNLIEIETTMKNAGLTIPLVPEMITFILSCFVVFKFILSYLSLAAHVIALYPILNYDLSDLLIPTILIQAIQNVLLNLIELWFGYFTCHYYLDKATTACKVFYFKMITKFLMGVVMLNIFWKHYNNLRYSSWNVIPTRIFLKRISNNLSDEEQDEENIEESLIYQTYETETDSEENMSN